MNDVYTSDAVLRHRAVVPVHSTIYIYKTAVCSVVHHAVKTKVLGYDKPTTPIYSTLGLET